MTKPMFLCLAALALSLTACGKEADDEGKAPPPAIATAPPGPGPDALPPKRSLVQARVMQTRADNLVLDPTFASANALYAATLYASDAAIAIATPATSPAGPTANVLDVKPTGSDAAVILAAQGGEGPLDVSVFVARASEEGTTDPSLYLTSASGLDAFELAYVAGKDQKHGAKTYRLFATRVTTPMYGKIYLVAQSGTPFTLAAPDMLAGGTTLERHGAPVAPRSVAMNAAAARAVHAFAHRPVVPDPPRAETSIARTLGRISTPGL